MLLISCIVMPPVDGHCTNSRVVPVGAAFCTDVPQFRTKPKLAAVGSMGQCSVASSYDSWLIGSSWQRSHNIEEVVV